LCTKEASMPFRKEVQHADLHGNLGTTRIPIQVPYRITGVFAFCLFGLITVFVFFAQTSERVRVQGYLDTEEGILNVYSPITGLLQQSDVEEGQEVHKNEPLFTVSNLEHENNRLFLSKLKQRITNLRHELQLKKEHYRALSILHQKKFVSTSVLENAQMALLELENRIKLEDIELMKYKEHSYQIIRSPIDGVATNIFYQPGQQVVPSKSLVHIIPKEAKFIAKLFVPSKCMGFLKKGQSILIQYDAYPAPRFGFYKAFIREINLTVLTDSQEDKPLRIAEPYYKVKAELEKSYVLFYGIKKELSHGMTLTAVLTTNKKTIWQWIFDPLKSYLGETRS
jgi:membrane fusion protein